MTSMKRAIIFDDHALFAETFSMLLEKVNFFDSAHTFSSQEKLRSFFLDEYNQLRKEELFLFSDYIVPGCNVNSLIADTRKIYPNIKVIVVTTVKNPVLIQQAMHIQPDGFISKSLGVSEIEAAIHAISSGEYYVSANIREALEQNTEDNPVCTLTKREIDVLSLIAKGYNTKEIAERMNVSTHTVVAHRRNMMAKINCTSVTKLLSFALANGLLPVYH